MLNMTLHYISRQKSVMSNLGRNWCSSYIHYHKKKGGGEDRALLHAHNMKLEKVDRAGAH